MSRKFFWVLFFIGVLIFGVNPCLATADNYYPLQVGNSWTYRIDIEGQVSEAQIRVAQKAMINNQETMLVETMTNGAVRQREYYSVSPEGVFTVMRSKFRFDPFQYFLKYPVVVGDTWQQKGKLADDSGNYSFTYTTRYTYEGIVSITVEGETFSALKLVMENQISDGSVSRAARYFVNGIGIVKEINVTEWKGRKVTVVSQLIKYNIVH